MKFINKNIKLIIGIIVSMLLVSGISVYATYTYFATDISYTRNGTEISVAQALNELYNNKQDVSELNTLKYDINQTDATAEDILNGKSAYTKNGLITGTSSKKYTQEEFDLATASTNYWKKENYSMTSPNSGSGKYSKSYNCGYRPKMALIKYYYNSKLRYVWSFDGCQNFYYGFIDEGTTGSANAWIRGTDNGFELYNWEPDGKTYSFEIWTIK